jgi:hypothetical protein
MSFNGANPEGQVLAGIRMEISNAIAAILLAKKVTIERTDTGYIRTPDYAISVQNYDRMGDHVGFRISATIRNHHYVHGHANPWTIAKDVPSAIAKFNEKILPKLTSLVEQSQKTQAASREAEAQKRDARKQGLALIAADPNFPLKRVNKPNQFDDLDIFHTTLANGTELTLEWHYGTWRILVGANGRSLDPEVLLPLVKALTEKIGVQA